MSVTTKYRGDIDGLRAIAVSAVIAFHLNPLFFTGGFIGVDIFFVISGYLITGIIVKEIDEGSFSLYSFYLRRMKRILPALFVVIFFTLVLSILILRENDFVFYSKAMLYAMFQISNLLFQKDVGYFDPSYENMPLLHTWSLGVEEQFYLFFPFLLLISNKIVKSSYFSIFILVKPNRTPDFVNFHN